MLSYLCVVRINGLNRKLLDYIVSLKIVENISYGDEIFAVGLRKGSDLKADLDAFLKAQYANGTITALAEKYGVGINTEALSK